MDGGISACIGSVVGQGDFSMISGSESNSESSVEAGVIAKCSLVAIKES